MEEFPTEEDLKKLLEKALEAIEKGHTKHIYLKDYHTGKRVIFHLARDLAQLDACCPEYPIENEDDYWDVIEDCLKLALTTPLTTYRPSDGEDSISKHKEAYGEQLHAFLVTLEDFTRPIYTKFALKELSDGTYYVSIDCHPTRNIYL